MAHIVHSADDPLESPVSASAEPTSSPPPAGEAPLPPVQPVRSRRPMVIGAVGAVVLTLLGLRFLSTFGTESTDNAQVDGQVVVVPARVGGVVASLDVREGSAVKQGDVLAHLDPSDLQVKVAIAEADLAAATAARDAAQAQLAVLTGSTEANLQGASAGVKSAQAGISSAQEAIRQAQAAVDGAEARATQASADKARAEQLVGNGGITRQAFDQALAADAAAQATLAQARAGLAAARANADGSRERLSQALATEAQARTGDSQVQAALSQLKAADARVAQSQASLDGARLQLGYTEVKAPFDGVVVRRAVEVGQNVGPGSGVVGLVGTREVWVMANFKETQVEHMKPGQAVEIEIDALPGQTFEGKVEAVTQATGARFSLIPPDNASGNFTKVVQRIPVRISLPPEAAAVARPGENAVVTVELD